MQYIRVGWVSGSVTQQKNMMLMQYRRSQTKGGSFFFTIVTHERQKILCHDENAALINEAFQRVTLKYPFDIDAFVLLPDHIHCIWTLPRGDNDFSTRWRLIKSYFTKGCRDEYKNVLTLSRSRKNEQAIWQRRFWEHTIRDENDFSRHVDYIHYNPVRHGLPKSPREWPHSSFHQYVKRGIYDFNWGSGEKIEFEEHIGEE